MNPMEGLIVNISRCFGVSMILIPGMFLNLGEYEASAQEEKADKVDVVEEGVDGSCVLPLDDEILVARTFDSLEAGIESGDIDQIMSLYEPDSVVYFEPGIPVYGLAGIEQGFRALISLRPEFTFLGYEVIVTGDLALHLSPYFVEGTSPVGPVEFSGLSTVVMRKGDSGEWTIVIDDPYGDRSLPN